jgi:AcrR family transcriptional regulator
MASNATYGEPLDEIAPPPMLDSAPQHPPSPCASALDPRIRRTRELLQQALATLLETRDFERISVQDITDAATVNRATFYAHYPDKFALLECMIAGQFQSLLADRGVVFDGTCSAALHGIVLGVCDYLAQTLNRAPQHTTADRHMEPHLDSALVAVIRGMLLHGISLHPPAGNVPPAILASTVSWAIYGAAREWAMTPVHTPSEQIAPVIVALVQPFLTGPR